MKRLVCSKCGFKTNAVADGATRVVCCLGCFKNPKATYLKKGGLRDAIESALVEYENLPDWMKTPDRIKRVSGYADL